LSSPKLESHLEKLALVLWDFDGTIADSEPIHFKCYQEILKGLGKEIDPDYYYREITSYGGGPQKLIDDFDLPHTATELKAEKRKKYRSFAERGEIKLFPLAGRILTLQKRKGLKLIVCSNTAADINQIILESNGFDQRNIASWFAPEKDTPRKPDPAMFLQALKVAGHKREESLIIEDTHIGVQAGVAAGIATVFLRAHHNQHLDLPENGIELTHQELREAFWRD
jgi:HAD superfamily hydrolase (TIGR01509 family)